MPKGASGNCHIATFRVRSHFACQSLIFQTCSLSATASRFREVARRIAIFSIPFCLSFRIFCNVKRAPWYIRIMRTAAFKSFAISTAGSEELRLPSSSFIAARWAAAI